MLMELFRLFGKIAVDNTEAKTALDETSAKANDSANETDSAFAKIGGAAKKVALGIGAAGLAIGGAFIGAVEGTREYRAEMGLLESAFLTAGHSSDEAKRTYSELNAVLGDSGQAVEASQHLAKIADNEKELAGLTNILTGVYATFGESLPLEGLAEGINHSASLGEVQGSLADALEWSGISVESFNEQLAGLATEEERQDLIVKTLNDTYSAASTQYKETNADVMAARQAQERLKDAIAEVGRVGEPILTAITNVIAGMAEKAVPVVESMVEKFRDMVTWVKNNQETVHAWVGVISGATVAIGTFLLIISWGKIMTAAANAIKVVRTAMLAMNAVMLANPIGLVVAAIAGLVAAFVYLWNNVEGFRNFWKSAWKTIQSLASSAWKAIRKYFSDAWTAIKKTWSAVAGYFRGIWNGIKSTFSSVGSWFKDKFRSALNGVKSAWNSAKSFFSGIWSGIKGVFGSVNTWFRSKFQSAWSAIKSVFSGWGSFFSGLWSKVKSKFGSIGSSIGTAMGNAVKNGMNGALSKVESAINKGIGLINSAIRLANKLPGINVGTVGTISLPRLAKGGVLEAGQVGILEGSGAEAVVPLEHNRAWLSRVAEDLNELQSMDKQPVNNDAMVARLNKIIELLEKLLQMNICLDSGVLVGELVPAIDAGLGRMYSKSNRGNTRTGLI
jgi:phage-related protein